MTTVAELGEAGLLAAIKRRLGGGGPGVLLGVGDDAAVLRAVGPAAVLTADMLVEDVDFERRWATMAEVGKKAAAVNLSDLAAMGARPRAALLSLALAPHEEVRDVLALVAAVHREGRRHGAPLVGGDLSRTAGPLVISVTMIGEASPDRVLERQGGRPGDLLLVSGTLGAAAAGLAILRGVAESCALTPSRRRALVRRQLTPTPRLALGRALALAKVVRSCADISDGLAKDAAHVVTPGSTFVLDVEGLPIAPGVAEVARALGKPAWELALAGGEDFELVLAVAAARLRQVQAVARACGVPLSVIGEVVRGRAPRLRGVVQRNRLPAAFDHFSMSPTV